MDLAFIMHFSGGTDIEWGRVYTQTLTYITTCSFCACASPPSLSLCPALPTASTHNTETSEVTLEMAAIVPETPPPPLKDYRLTQSYEDDQSQASDEKGEEEGGIVHTSSFSFSAHKVGRVVGSH